VNETDVQEFWQHHPCGETMVGGLTKFQSDYEKFFDEYDQFRYGTEGHILTCLDTIDFAGKRTLEIGLGQGADAEQIIRRGGKWSGVDLTSESIDRVRVRMELKQLPYENLVQGSVLDLPFEGDSFDIVFSHGVLHHVPEIHKAQAEIQRVLKADGRLITMLYAKFSLNYLLSISVIRRLGLAVCYLIPGISLHGIVGQHLRNARTVGLLNYCKMTNFVHRNTDGPSNPYSKVYDIKSVKHDFGNFDIVRYHKEFMHAPPLPVKFLPLSDLLGWHLWVHMVPKKLESPSGATIGPQRD